MMRTSSLRGMSAAAGLSALLFLAACGASGSDAATPEASTTATAALSITPIPTTTASAAATPSATTVASATPAPSGSASATPAFDWEHETVGGVAAGMQDAEIIKLIGKPDKDPAPVNEGATGDWVKPWAYAKLGLELSLYSSKKAGPYAIKTIWVGKGSKLKTGRGIAIGAKKADVLAAYGTSVNPELTSDSQVGIGVDQFSSLKFALEKGVVTSIMFGGDGE